ncbi:helix-turn-helix domain-containing protein [Phaeovulum sp.]|uniref:helix-turn-helix domain-containing protein n=1 Tax=Phaeovulum sp. TaxID=2934796 RepID=UPI0039E5C884
MIGRRAKPSTADSDKPKGFDDFELRLGDVMRGERATLAKSLLDVQRELRIKASYIAAIENADITAFDTPSFIAGYVRSYARYLGMDADWAFERFCIEAGFAPTHGMAPAASGPKPQRRPSDPAEALANPNASFVPRAESMFSRIEPRALGSVLVLALLAGGLGYGGWTVLQEVQRVQLSPVDQAPGVVAELDPLSSVQPVLAGNDTDYRPDLPTPEAMDRIYRPQALDAPVLVARDGPISAIDPRTTGVLAGLQDGDATVTQPLTEASDDSPVRTVAADAPAVELLAVRPSWVRVQASDGTVILEKVLDAGERFALPPMEEPPVLRTGESGAIYFAVNGATYGPAGAAGQVTKNIQLSPDALSTKFAVADLARDDDLARMVAVAQAGPAPTE